MGAHVRSARARRRAPGDLSGGAAVGLARAHAATPSGSANAPRARDCRLRRLGTGTVRQGARRIRVAHDRPRRWTARWRPGRRDVGDRHSAARGRSGRTADELGRTLMGRIAVALALASALAGVACRREPPPPGAQSLTDPMVQQLRSMTARFAPVDLTADIASLPPNERQALAKLIEAAKVLDSLFLRQVWAGNEPLLLTLVRDSSDLGRARLHYFLINKGP